MHTEFWYGNLLEGVTFETERWKYDIKMYLRKTNCEGLKRRTVFLAVLTLCASLGSRHRDKFTYIRNDI